MERLDGGEGKGGRGRKRTDVTEVQKWDLAVAVFGVWSEVCLYSG